MQYLLSSFTFSPKFNKYDTVVQLYLLKLHWLMAKDGQKYLNKNIMKFGQFGHKFDPDMSQPVHKW